MGASLDWAKAYGLDARLHDAATETLLAGEHFVAARPEQVLSSIDLLSRKLASELGAHALARSRGTLAEAMTDSLPAYRFYSLALDAAHGYRTSEALDLLRLALETDPGFVLARARMGYVRAMVDFRVDEAKPHLEVAFRERDRLTDKDRRLLVAWYAVATTDYEGAMRAYRDLIERYLLDVESYWRLAYLLRGEERQEEAVEILERRPFVESRSPEIFNALGLVRADTGAHEEAIAAHRRYVELDPQEPNAYDCLAMSLHWAGRYEEAEQMLENSSGARSGLRHCPVAPGYRALSPGSLSGTGGGAAACHCTKPR